MMKWLLVLVSYLIPLVVAVDRAKFKTCAQSPFCSSHRGTLHEPRLYVPETEDISLTLNDQFISGVLSVDIENIQFHGEYPLVFTLYYTATGALRFNIHEKDSKKKRWTPPFILPLSVEQMHLNSSFKLIRNLNEKSVFLLISKGVLGSETISGSPKHVVTATLVIEVSKRPSFGIRLFRTTTDWERNIPFLNINEFGQTYFDLDLDHLTERRDATAMISDEPSKDNEVHEPKEREILDWGEDGNPIYAGEETSNMDENKEVGNDSDGIEQKQISKSIGVDITFVQSSGLFGLPEHTTSFSLPDTVGEREPFRLYTLDVFEYELDETMALYGAIPMIHSFDSVTRTASAIFWNNPTDTFVDISSDKEHNSNRKVNFFSESGAYDLFIFPGRGLHQVMKQIRDTTGPAILPPIFSLAYHQCRWNYNDQNDLLAVHRGFEDNDIPVDVLWLDIEHTNGRRYFTFDDKKFPDPVAMYKEIGYFGRKVVNIVDPHIKRDNNYHIHKEAERLNIYIKDSSGQKDFDGWCWPGSSSYIDFTAEAARQFWCEQFQTDDAHYKGTVGSVVHIWNDMNEPSVFNHAEVTIPKDTKNYEGVEFREFHNTYGLYFQASTQAGLIYRSSKDDACSWRALKYVEGKKHACKSAERGFVLSRAFYAGSQRFGAIWTGDNKASWDHLRISVPMILSASIVGLPFIGADVGGFFGNPSPELLIRWYQAGSFQPFFRAHAHLESKRREPWLFGHEVMMNIRSAIARRYRYLPYIYTVFKQAERAGLPVMRPMFFEFDEIMENEFISVDDQWMLGDSLLIAPIMDDGSIARTILVPKGLWYDFTVDDYIDQMRVLQIHQIYQRIQIQASLSELPHFHRAGTVIVRKDRLRRSSSHMFSDPLTLVVALDENGKASGTLYLDDETTFDYVDNDAYCDISFNFENNVLRSAPRYGNKNDFLPENMIEQIIILSPNTMFRSVESVSVEVGDIATEVELQYIPSNGAAIIRNPGLRIVAAFSVTFPSIS